MKTFLFPFFLSRVFFLLCALGAASFIPLNEGYLGRQLLEGSPYLAWIWANFDGRHFLNIATLGYRDFDFAYFPFYPLLVSVFGSVTSLNFLNSGIAINILSFTIASYVLYKITLLDYPKEVATLAVVLISFFPLSFFYHSVYPDALFLMLATLSFYFARKKSWFLSAMFLSLTISTRISGVALAAAIAWELVFGEYIVKKNLIKKTVNWCFISLLLAVLGLLPYLIYLQMIHGDWLLFQKSMIAWGQSGFVLLPQVLYRYFKILTSVDITLLVYWIAVFELATFIAYLLITYYVWKRVRQSYAVFMFLLLLMVTFTGTLAGTPRYMLHLFPGFIAMALIIGRSFWFRAVIIGVFLVLGFILTSLFTRGYFIAQHQDFLIA